MIVRVLTATLKAERAGLFNELMRTQLPILREYPGLRYAKLSRRILGSEQEVEERVVAGLGRPDPVVPRGFGLASRLPGLRQIERDPTVDFHGADHMPRRTFGATSRADPWHSAPNNQRAVRGDA